MSWPQFFYQVPLIEDGVSTPESTTDSFLPHSFQFGVPNHHFVFDTWASTILLLGAFIHSLVSVCYDRSITCSKTFLHRVQSTTSSFKFPVSCRLLKVIQ